MKVLKNALIIFAIFTLLCGVIYTAIVTGIAQLFFPNQANGSIIEVNGVKYGSSLLAQPYTDNSHMWGRIMNLDVLTFKDKDRNTLVYSAPSNLSSESEEYAQLVEQRVERIKSANPEMGNMPIPEDLVTCSGSGLDSHISPAAAEYQVKRLARAIKGSYPQYPLNAAISPQNAPC